MGVSIEVKVEGLDRALSQLGDLRDAAVRGVSRGLHEWALDTEGDCKGECPHKTGHLRRNIRAIPPEETSDGAIVSGVEDPVSYAIFVHENLEARHDPPYGQGGKAKFIEDPIRRNAPELASRIGARISEAFKEAVG